MQFRICIPWMVSGRVTQTASLGGAVPIYPSNCLGATSMTHRSVLSRRRVLHGYRPRHSYAYCVIAHHAGTASAPSVLQVVRVGPPIPLNVLNRERNLPVAVQVLQKWCPVEFN